MNESICRFMPAKNYTGNIKTINFVYETEFKKMNQPFFHAVYYVHLVTNGSAVLKIYENKHEIREGDIFFAFPGCPYEIEGTDDLKYIYISFMGSCVGKLFENLEISIEKPVYRNFDSVLELWLSSIVRVNQLNANILTESVLLYTLSFINNKSESVELKENSETFFDLIVDYIDNHYKDPDISLGKVANVFSYTEKYVSHIFKKNMKIGFSTYVNNLRIQYAHELIAKFQMSVAEIASLCGYSDSLYFSKVFKKRVGTSPTEYIKRIKGC